MAKIEDVVNGQAAEMALLRILVIQIFRRSENKQKILEDFNSMSEDHIVKALYSTMPESFFSDLQSSRDIYSEMLEECLRQNDSDS